MSTASIPANLNPCTIAWCDKTCKWEVETNVQGEPTHRLHKSESEIWDVTLFECYDHGEYVLGSPVFEVAYGVEIEGLGMAAQAAADLFLLARTVQTSKEAN